MEILYVLAVLSALLTLCGPFVSGAEQGEAKSLTEQLRKQLNVYTFSSADYPAIFAIVAGLVLVLVIGIAFTVSGMLSMKPSKDSIIYRMAATRPKKD